MTNGPNSIGIISRYQPGSSTGAAPHPLQPEELVDAAADVGRKPDPRLVVDIAAAIPEILDRLRGPEAIARLLVIGVALDPQRPAILSAGGGHLPCGLNGKGRHGSRHQALSLISSGSLSRSWRAALAIAWTAYSRPCDLED